MGGRQRQHRKKGATVIILRTFACPIPPSAIGKSPSLLPGASGMSAAIPAAPQPGKVFRTAPHRPRRRTAAPRTTSAGLDADADGNGLRAARTGGRRLGGNHP
ncbi:hypothetical protein GCM10012285_32640 [Streptomyces kronopolitis]|uniref:Uncharacterized protein n=1 Tax=Streptomyces kronopolitis TaxID=1612435 RepID=A0ABQ2JGN3_9ACTN|nr:hypothetical protein GCM10012285_32640 [Streptomyces kronopolitis]